MLLIIITAKSRVEYVPKCLITGDGSVCQLFFVLFYFFSSLKGNSFNFRDFQARDCISIGACL